MRKLLLLLLVPLLSSVFVTVEQFNELNAQVNQLEERVAELESQQNPLLNETLYAESENFSISIVIENGYWQSLTVCELDATGSCETSTEKIGEQIVPLYQTDRQDIFDDIYNYLELLEYLREMWL